MRNKCLRILQFPGDNGKIVGDMTICDSRRRTYVKGSSGISEWDDPAEGEAGSCVGNSSARGGSYRRDPGKMRAGFGR